MSTEDLCDEIARLSEKSVAVDERLVALKERVDKREARAWQLVGAAVALLLAAFGVARYVVLLEGRITSLEQRLERRENRDRPAEPFPLLPSWVAPPSADADTGRHTL